MIKKLARTLPVLMLGLQLPVLASAQSVFTSRLDDPKAVYVNAPADGATDDTAAIQTAIDQAAAQAHEGIVFIPSGRYHLTHTVYVWPGSVCSGMAPAGPCFCSPNTRPDSRAAWEPW